LPSANALLLWALAPETGSRSSAQYGDFGSLGRNRPVTRSEVGGAPGCTEPGVTCSRLATAVGSATGSGPPSCGGPGHSPAVSVAWALIPASDAGCSCLMAMVAFGLVLFVPVAVWESRIGSAHSALSIWKPTPGQALRSV